MAFIFTGNIFKSIFVNEKFCIMIWISLKFIRSGTIDNKQALVQVMAISWTDADPSSPTHICGTRRRWIKINIYLYHFIH